MGPAQCVAGDQAGCVAIGLLHMEGSLVTQDVARAAKIFEAACAATA
jgi:TPR repeat protein